MAFKFHLLVFHLMVCLMWASPSAASRGQPSDPMMKRFEEWMAENGRVYNDDVEKLRRFQIFQDNVNYVETFNNRSGNSYTLGVNQFADMTTDEFLAQYTGLSVPANQKSEPLMSFEDVNLSSAPQSVDWRDDRAVTEVKQQGTCSSCWAFVAAATVEGIYKIKKGILPDVSEQQILDCSHSYGCKRGGFVEKGYDFIIANKGVTTEPSYPYNGVIGTCVDATIVPNEAYITGYKFLPKNERSIMNAVSQQPVAAAVDADKNFQLYRGGIFKGPCGTKINHAITIIGYGEDDTTGDKFWIIKNSWGQNWGEAGYIRLQRESGSFSGLCGIARYALYPTLTSMPHSELSDTGSDSITSSI
ncbi:fruit bromelain-like [Ananas comosus]|uniref:Fruit bromelain-like n=1 Tax=Ananas comosus TaxID=4615 RepID=A0A6P5F6W5_ANACO|nr:fruit bromelain-like [Ananas comosus]